MSEQKIVKELENLQTRADALGIQYHPSIGAGKLSNKIQEHLTMKDAEADSNAMAVKTSAEMREHLRADAEQKLIWHLTELIRVRITCLDPDMNQSDVVHRTFGNSVIPTTGYVVPFNKNTHIPRMLLNILNDEYYTNYTPTATNGIDSHTDGRAKRFVIEELTPLTEKELNELAISQRQNVQ